MLASCERPPARRTRGNRITPGVTPDGDRAMSRVGVPIFVSSEMTYPVQAADMVIYCVNWGFRVQANGMTAPTRPEIAGDFGPWLNQLQYVGHPCR